MTPKDRVKAALEKMAAIEKWQNFVGMLQPSTQKL